MDNGPERLSYHFRQSILHLYLLKVVDKVFLEDIRPERSCGYLHYELRIHPLDEIYQCQFTLNPEPDPSLLERALHPVKVAFRIRTDDVISQTSQAICDAASAAKLGRPDYWDYATDPLGPVARSYTFPRDDLEQRCQRFVNTMNAQFHFGHRATNIILAEPKRPRSYHARTSR